MKRPQKLTKLSPYERLAYRQNRLNELQRIADSGEVKNREKILRSIQTVKYEIRSLEVDIQIMEHRTKQTT